MPKMHISNKHPSKTMGLERGEKKDLFVIMVLKIFSIMIKVSITERTTSFLMECYFKLHQERIKVFNTVDYRLRNEIGFKTPAI